MGAQTKREGGPQYCTVQYSTVQYGGGGGPLNMHDVLHEMLMMNTSCIMGGL